MVNATILLLGNLTMSRKVQALLSRGALDPFEYLHRHAMGDWGDISEEAKQANDAARRKGRSVYSVYPIAPDLVLWIITDADRRRTAMIIIDD